MPEYEAIRDRLPTLYRPQEGDPASARLPLRAADLAAVNDGAPPAIAERGDGSLDLTFDAPTAVRSLRFAAGVSPGTVVTVELRRFPAGVPAVLPAATAPLVRRVAGFAGDFADARVNVRLVRPALFETFLRGAARPLDELGREAAEVMQAHWLDYADRGLFSPYLARVHELADAAPPARADADVVTFPFLDDLPRLGSLIPLPPWREPPASRERVEGYRQRIRRIVALYRRGVGTLPAVRAMAEASLPVDLTAPAGLRDRPLGVEEFAPLVRRVFPAPTRAQPDAIVGPLMRWAMTNDGLEAAPPTLYVEGTTPDSGVDPTARPLLELFSAGGNRVRIGIAYEGTVAAGQVLRVRPAYSSWLAGDGGLAVATALPADDAPASRAAAGPWSAAPGAPGGPVTAVRQVANHSLWAATFDAGAGTGSLWRFDGATWTEALPGLPEVHALAADGDDLLVGTASGLFRLPLYPPEGEAFAPAPAPGDLSGPAVHALLRGADGTWWVGAEQGLARLGDGDVLDWFGLGAVAETAVPVYALFEDATGSLYVGTQRGLFEYQPSRGHWYWYEGREHSESAPDWRPFRPEASGDERGFPAEDDVFLPPVRAVRRGPDAALWVGTDAGIARYYARPARGLAYSTLLEAFADLAAGPVTAIEEDGRRGLWFATTQGLFRYDGRDFWQAQSGAFVRLPLGNAVAPDPEEPRFWRFDRAGGHWQSLDPASPGALWTAFTPEPRGTAEPAVRALAWTAGAAADLGSFDGDAFTSDPGATPAALRMRYKPTDDRVVDGGIPAVPLLPVGDSTWRYLALESTSDAVSPRRPAWTIEGRLLPPPDAAPPLEGRFGQSPAAEFSDFDDAAFAFHPAARVRFEWEARRPFTVLVRLGLLDGEGQIAPAVLDRVWQGVEQVRPAGVRALVAVEDRLVRGETG